MSKAHLNYDTILVSKTYFYNMRFLSHWVNFQDYLNDTLHCFYAPAATGIMLLPTVRFNSMSFLHNWACRILWP